MTTPPLTMKPARRPRSATCPRCGEPVSLIDCGVKAHRRTRTARERIEGRCPGRVYAHDATGGIECNATGGRRRT